MLGKFLFKCAQHKEFISILSFPCFQPLLLLEGSGVSQGVNCDKLQATEGQGTCLICVLSEAPCSEHMLPVVSSQ